jgi:hypothetical protein
MLATPSAAIAGAAALSNLPADIVRVASVGAGNVLRAPTATAKDVTVFAE